MGEAADRLSVLARLLLEKSDVAQRVSALVLGIVAGVDRLAAGHLARVRLDEQGAVVEAHGAAIGASTQMLADESRGQRVERFRDLRALVARDERLAPQRHVVLLARRGQQS